MTDEFHLPVVEVDKHPSVCERVREIEKESLDAVKVYEDVQFIEERRRKEGQPPVVRFLTSAEQKRWKRPDSSKPVDASDKGGNGISQGGGKNNKERKSGSQKRRTSTL